ncbi:MAG: DUF924 family protein, partial [Cyanobacteria bacterium J06649_11]
MTKRLDCYDILNFWFAQHSYQDWYSGSAIFDQKIKDRFSDVHTQAIKGELYPWRETLEGRLAEIIILDQFSRQLFRESAQAFAYDGMALALAQETVRVGDDIKLTEKQRHFVYLPYMHSESLVIHDEAVQLYTGLDNKDGLDFEHKHRVIIERFGRY